MAPTPLRPHSTESAGVSQLLFAAAACLALVLALYWIFGNARSKAKRVRAVASEDLASPELEDGLRLVLKPMVPIEAEPEAPPLPPGLPKSIDFSKTPYERPQPKPVDDRGAPTELGGATLDFLQQRYAATLERISFDEERLREAQAAQDQEAFENAARDFEADRNAARQLNYQIGVMRNGQR